MSLAFVLTDVVFLTAILQVQRDADISHATAYVLVILMAGLSLNRWLIWIAGTSSIAGYLYLVRQDEEIAWHIPVIMVVLLGCCLLVIDYQVRRLSVWIRPKSRQSSEGQ